MNSEQQTAATMAEAVSPSMAPASLIDAKLVRHTRRCNGRDVCSCMLRVESAYFQKNLAGKAATKKRRVDGPATVSAKAMTRKYQKVTNIQQLNFDLKLRIAAFLAPLALGRLGMVRAVQGEETGG